MSKRLINQNVLVLNKGFMPVHITTVRDAVGLVYVGAGKIVVTDNMNSRQGQPIVFEWETLNYQNWIDISEKLDDQKITMVRSSNKKHFIPSVILLTRWNGVPRYEVKFCRTTLFERDNGECQYCGIKIPKMKATIDHVVPKSRGGKNTWKNTVLSCKHCNERKDDRTPVEANMPLRSVPKKPSWIRSKLGKAQTIKEHDTWGKFLNYV